MPWTDKSICEQDGQGDGIKDRNLSYAEAIREAHEILLERNPDVFVIGEGVSDCGGIFGSTRGLAEKFGPERVMDIPIAENGITGVAIGAAMAGLKPIFVHMRTDFLTMCMDQIVNQAAKWHFMTGGKTCVPIVIRALIGRGWGSGAQHSQSLHSMFMSIPGLKIALPSTPYDAKGMLLAASEDPNPVLIFEHRWLYGIRGPVPEAPYIVPFGKAAIRRTGTDVTVLAVSHSVIQALQATEKLAELGISIDLIDLGSLFPLDMESIMNSIKKTGRLVICDVACRNAGYGAEIAARIAEENPGMLRAPMRRVSFPDLPTPASPVLEEKFYPGEGDIVAAVLDIMGK